MHASAVQSITIKVSEVDSALLNDADELQKLLRNVTELAGLHSLESVMHQFSPQGISAALLLSESHIAIHTWPESSVAYIAMMPVVHIPTSPSPLLKVFRLGKRISRIMHLSRATP